jgi:hypothetical protein
VVLGAVAAFLGAAAPAGSTHAAIVSWTGLGDGVNWSNPANWSGGVLPGPGDDVAINVAGTPTIVIAGVSPTVRSLSTLEVLRIETGAVVRAATATCRASVQMAGGTISGGQWTMTGGANLQIRTGLSTLDGARIVAEAFFPYVEGRLQFLGGSTVTQIRVQEDRCSALFEPGAVINFPIIMAQGAGNSFFSLQATQTGTITLGPAGTIGGSWSGELRVGDFVGNAHFVNQGTITATGTGRTLSMRGHRFTNAPGGVITVSGGTTLINQTGDGPVGGWTNEGTITLSGSLVTLQGQWDNRGTIRATNSTINLRGNFDTDDVLNIERSGGTLNIEGVLDNTGRTTTLNATTGSWVLNNGTIRGGTLSWVDPHRILFSNFPGNLVDSVEFRRELVLTRFDGVFTIAGAARMVGIRAIDPIFLRYAEGAVINYPIVADSATAGTLWVRTSVNGGGLTIGPQGSITTAPGSRLGIRIGDGNGGTGDPVTGRLTNHGRIESNVSGSMQRIRAGLVQNHGTIRVGNGVQAEVIGLSGEVGTLDTSGANTRLTVNGNYTLRGAMTVGAGGLLRLNGSWRNEGSILVAGGTLELGGTFPTIRPGSITSSGGTVTIVGTLNNNGTLVLDSTTGSWGVSGGIVGGSVVQSEGSRIVPIGSPAFLDVAIGGELLVSNANARPRIEGSTRAGSYRVTGSGAGLFFTPGHMLREEVVYEGDSPGRGIETSGQNGVLTISPEGRIRVLGGSVDIGARHSNASGRVIDLQGVIEAVGPGSTAVINSPVLANLDSASGRLVGGTWRALQGGSISFNNRSMRVNAATIELEGDGATPTDLALLERNEGTLRLSGGRDMSVLAAAEDPVLFTNAGRLELGAGSILSVGSEANVAGFAQTAQGSTRFTLAGVDPAQHGLVRAAGVVTLGGAAEAQAADGFSLACGHSFGVIAASSVEGRFASLIGPPTPVGSVLIAAYDASGVRLAVSPDGDFNRDGFVDAFDYLDFVGCFEDACGPDQNADVNRDGFVDFFDYQDFVGAFERGC